MQPKRYTRSAETRRKLSEVKAQQWADPAFRRKMADARRANPIKAWNKGAKLSPETRERMAAAKRGRTHAMSTLARMSASATGRRHSLGTVVKIASSKRGVKLSPMHRAAISMAQKRRHAARRVLAAVEAVHRDLSIASDPAGLPLKMSALFPRDRSGSSVEDLQNEYTMQLREFRSLQAELRPWMDAFQKRHGRKPTAQDATGTDVKWIATRFQQFQALKGKLMAEIPVLRSEMAAAQGLRPGRRAGGKARGEGTVNANRPAVSRKGGAARVQAALDYKQQRHARAAGDAPAKRLPGAAPGAPAARAAADYASPEVASKIEAVQAVRAGGANSRAQSALLKAMEYKKRAAAAAGGAGAASAAGSMSEGPSSGSQNAIKMVTVDGKTINGVSYDGVDASQARAGESSFVQVGRMPVVSSSRRRWLDDDDEVAPTPAAGPGAAVTTFADEAAAGHASLTAAISIEGVQAAQHRGTNSRAQSALLKAMDYKKRTATAAGSAGAAEHGTTSGGPAAGSQNAIKMVTVDGKTINGVSYDGVDASQARAGESSFIQVGRMPVVSSSRRRWLDDDDEAPTQAAGPGAAAAPPSSFNKTPRVSDDESDEDGGGPSGGGGSGGDATPSVVREWEAALAAAEDVCAEPAEAPVAAFVGTGHPVTLVLLDLRSKQALATAALAHAAATTAVQDEALGMSSGASDAAEAARVAARRALQEFDEARERAKELLAGRLFSYSGGLKLAAG